VNLLLIKRCNLYKVLACSTTFLQLSLFCVTFFQWLMFMRFISSKMSSSQRVLGLPIGLLDMSFHLLIFCTILSSAMRSTWPNQFNLCFFNKLSYINCVNIVVKFRVGEIMSAISLFWDVSQRRLLVNYRRLSTTYRSHLQVSNSPPL